MKIERVYRLKCNVDPCEFPLLPATPYLQQAQIFQEGRALMNARPWEESGFNSNWLFANLMSRLLILRKALSSLSTNLRVNRRTPTMRDNLENTHIVLRC